MTHFTPHPGAAPVPFQTIREYAGGKLYIEVQNTTKPNGKTDYANTSTHGSTLIINQNQIANP